MTTWAVPVHEHDEAAGVYRLVVGVPVTDTRPVVDADGDPVLDADGDPETETVVVRYDQTHEVVLADDDDRWFTGTGTSRQRRPAADVAAEQRALVRDALAAQEAAEAAPPPDPTPPTPMPGAGGDL